jgi:hypothetical protein
MRKVMSGSLIGVNRTSAVSGVSKTQLPDIKQKVQTSPAIQIDEYEKIGDAWVAYIKDSGGIHSHLIVKDDQPARAHSYLYTLLKHIEINKGITAYENIVYEKLGLTNKQVNRLRTKPSEMNTLVLEEAVLNYFKACFADDGYEEICRQIEDVGFKSGSLEYAANQSGTWKTRLVHIYFIFAKSGKYSRVKSTVSHGVSRSTQSFFNSVFRKKMGAYIAFVYDSIPNSYNGRKIIAYPGLKRPSKLVLKDDFAKKYRITLERKEFDPTRETVYGHGLVSTDLPPMGRSICDGTVFLKNIRSEANFELRKIPCCVDQYPEWGHDAETGVALRYSMNEDGTFSDQFGRLLYSVDKNGSPLEIPVSYFIKEQYVRRDNELFVVNSDRAELIAEFNDASFVEKIRLYASDINQKPVNEVTTKDMWRTLFQRNKFKAFIMPITAVAIPIGFSSGFSTNPLATAMLFSLLFVLNVFGHFYEKKTKDEIQKNIYALRERAKIRERAHRKNEKIIEALETSIKNQETMEEREKLLEAVFGNLNEGLILIDQKKDNFL